MARLAIAKDFLVAFSKLEKPVQKRVVELIDKFEGHTFAGVHLEKPKGARDPRIRTVRVDKYWRGVVLDLGGGDYCLMRVVPHDDAYDKTHTFSVHARLGVLEVRDQAGLEAIEPVLRRRAERATNRLFDGVSDADLVRLGIDEELLPIVRLIDNEDGLIALEPPRVPRHQYDALAGLASGMTVEEVWAEVAADVAAVPAAGSIDTGDLGAAARRTPDWVAFVEGDDELAQMLRPPFSAWRRYLHAAQRDVAFHSAYSGPFLLTGAAGTGKTVVALHRAHHLARNAADPAPGGRPPVLVTTFTKALATTLGAQLDELVEDQRVRARIEVIGVDALAMRIVHEAWEGYPKILIDGDARKRWKDAAKRAACTRSVAFLDREWRQVVLAQRITTGAAYMTCSRRGSGVALARSQRGPVWHAIERFTNDMRTDKLWTHLELADAAADRLTTDQVTYYRHIVVDEAQDLHPAQWRLLRAAVPPGRDDLFITGDPHQRIYNPGVTLSSLGVTTSGRARRLRVSYRTTQEILTTAVPTLGVEPIDGLEDRTETLAGYRSLLHGRRPVFRAYGDRHEELAGLVTQIRAWLDAGIEAEAIGVAGRGRKLVADARSALEAAGVATTELTGSEPEAVRLGTMHAMKGLEFGCVAVIGAESGIVPATKSVTPIEEDPVAHAEDTQRERCLLFVACTRPRDVLVVSYSGTPSRFLPAHTPSR